MIWPMKHPSHCISIQNILSHFPIHCYVITQNSLSHCFHCTFTCISVNIFMLMMYAWFNPLSAHISTEHSPFSFTPSTLHPLSYHSCFICFQTFHWYLQLTLSFFLSQTFSVCHLHYTKPSSPLSPSHLLHLQMHTLRLSHTSLFLTLQFLRLFLEGKEP